MFVVHNRQNAIWKKKSVNLAPVYSKNKVEKTQAHYSVLTLSTIIQPRNRAYVLGKATGLHPRHRQHSTWPDKSLYSIFPVVELWVINPSTPLR